MFELGENPGEIFRNGEKSMDIDLWEMMKKSFDWAFEDGYICPRCENEDHPEGAHFCKICGLKIEKEE